MQSLVKVCLLNQDRLVWTIDVPFDFHSYMLSLLHRICTFSSSASDRFWPCFGASRRVSKLMLFIAAPKWGLSSFCSLMNSSASRTSFPALSKPLLLLLLFSSSRWVIKTLWSARTSVLIAWGVTVSHSQMATCLNPASTCNSNPYENDVQIFSWRHRRNSSELWFRQNSSSTAVKARPSTSYRTIALGEILSLLV